MCNSNPAYDLLKIINSRSGRELLGADLNVPLDDLVDWKSYNEAFGYCEELVQA